MVYNGMLVRALNDLKGVYDDIGYVLLDFAVEQGTYRAAAARALATAMIAHLDTIII